MKVTALVDNTRLAERTDLAIERGLSIHIETAGMQILFDAGSSNAFCDNAARLGISMASVNAAVISHRHHDHCNGITHFLDANLSAQVYLRTCESSDYYFKAFGFKHNVGMDPQLLEKGKSRFEFVDGVTEILPNVFIITQISQQYTQPQGNKYLYTKSDAGHQQDDFEHELLLVIQEDDGLVVFTGCAHSGVLNMVETAVSLFPDTKIKAVVGGFHLVGLPLFNSIGGSVKDIEEIGDKLLNYPIERLYTGHCTGMKAFNILQSVMGERLEYLPTGRSVVI